MADDTEINTNAVVEEPTEATPAEETTTQEESVAKPADESPEPSQPEEEAEAPAETTTEDDGEQAAPEQMSRRKAKRLEKLEGLVERLRSQDKVPERKSDGINYRDMIDAPNEVYADLETKSKEFGDSQFSAGLEQAKSIQFHTRLELDSPKVETIYESMGLEQEQRRAIDNWYLSTVGYNSQTETPQNANLRYVHFVEAIKELTENVTSSKTAQTTQNIAKQAASTGLRPDGSSAKRLDLSKAPDQMTNEELNAAINANLPRDARGRFTS